MYTPRSNVGSSSRSASMSLTLRSQARLTVSLGVWTVTLGRRGTSLAGGSTALQPSVAGRRASDWVIGSQRRHECHVPLGGSFVTNTSLPFAYCGGASALSTLMISSRRNDWFSYQVF